MRSGISRRVPAVRRFIKTGGLLRTVAFPPITMATGVRIWLCSAHRTVSGISLTARPAGSLTDVGEQVLTRQCPPITMVTGWPRRQFIDHRTSAGIFRLALISVPSTQNSERPAIWLCLPRRKKMIWDLGIRICRSRPFLSQIPNPKSAFIPHPFQRLICQAFISSSG
jgi:hypothetical protein